MGWWMFLVAYWLVAMALIRPIFANLIVKPGYKAKPRSHARGDALIFAVCWLFLLIGIAGHRAAKGIGWLLFRETKGERVARLNKAEAAQKEADLRNLYKTEPELLPTRERERIKRRLEIEKIEKEPPRYRSYSQERELERLYAEIKRIDEIAREIDEKELKRA
jgi:hypothetical protein